MAAENLLQQSLHNSIKVVPILASYTGTGFPYTFPFRLGDPSILYHSSQFDQDWYINKLQDWQMKTDYAQKWQFSDLITCQFSVTSDTILNAAIYDCHGKFVVAVPQESITSFAGNLIYGYPTNTYQFAFSFNSLALNTGRYYLVLSITADEVVNLYISEPQEVKNNHEGTILINSNNSQNRYQQFFSINPKGFNLRVEGSCVIDSWSYSDTTFEAQGNETEISYSGNKRRYNLTVGDKHKARPATVGIPAYLIDQIVNFLGTDQVLIDGGQFVRNPNSDPEITRYETMPLLTGLFKLYEQNIADRRIFGMAQTRLVFPATYPFALDVVKFDGVTLANTQIIEDITDVEAIKTYAMTLGYEGTFDLDGSILTYSHIKGERKKSFFGSFATKQLRFTVTKNSTNSWQNFSYIGATTVIDFGQPLGVNNLQSFHALGSEIFIIKDYGAGAASSYLVTVWHNNDILHLTFTDSGSNFYLSSLDDTSDWPINCQSLVISDQHEFATLNADLFDNYDARGLKLNRISITGSILANLPSWASGQRIKSFDFTNNNIDSDEFEIFTDGLVSTVLAYNGFLGMIDQDPIAPATAGTLANLALLGAKGWAWTTD